MTLAVRCWAGRAERMAGGLARSARMAADTIVALPEEVDAWKQEITYQIGLLGTDDDEQESIFLHIQRYMYRIRNASRYEGGK